MRSQLLVSSVGEDRPGIVAKISELFVKHGANLEESRMSILGGEFAAIMLIDLPKANIDLLTSDLEALKKDAIFINTKITSPFSKEKYKDHCNYRIILKGADHEGIVHRVSSMLHSHHINIMNMETSVKNAPITGVPLFEMKASILIPPGKERNLIDKELQVIALEEQVDIDLVEVQTQTPIHA